MKKNAEAQLRKALDLHKLSKLGEAEQIYKSVLQNDPKNPDALHLLGVVLMARGELARAQELMVRAIKIKGNDAAYFSNLGIVLKDQGAFSAALGSFDQAIKLQPEYPEAFCNRGLALASLGRNEEALDHYDTAIKFRSNYAAAYSNRGVLLQSMGRLDDAVNSFRKAIAADPTFADGLSNYGALLRRLRRYDESLKVYNGALRVNPKLLEAYQGRGELLAEMGRIKEALADFDRALTIKPKYADALWGKSFTYLSSGDFSNGWNLYETRFDQSNKQCSTLTTDRPKWTPNTTPNTLLVWSEQGVGDEIFFSQWLDTAFDLARQIVVAVDERLLPLYRRSFPNIEFIDKVNGVRSANFDAHLPMGSLPYSRISQNKDWLVENRKPYLKPDTARSEEIRKSILGVNDKLIGITWKSTRPSIGPDKSLNLADFDPIFKIPGLGFVNLQYGDTADEINRLSAEKGIQVRNVPDVDNWSALDDHAALIAACDELVLVCNATAHIAGAMGKHAYVLTPKGKSLIWYWANRNGSRNYWYNSIEPIDQTYEDLSWTSAINELAQRLKRA